MLCSFTGELGKEFMKQRGSDILSIFFPPRCPVCDEVLFPDSRICADCAKKIMRVREPVCKKCGKPLVEERREYCEDCQKKKHFFVQGKAVFVFEGRIRTSMYRFKYGGRQEYAAFYASVAAEQYGRWLQRKGVEAIVPVPMYLWKKRRRGYNQAEVFAGALGRELDIPVECGLVRRIRNTAPQKQLNAEERVHNVKNAFQFAANIVKYKKVVLVDDIYTTGSTMDEVAKALLAAGISEVYYICISIGESY